MIETLIDCFNYKIFLPIFSLHGDDASALCIRNAKLADSVHRKDLVKTWTLLSLILSKDLVPQKVSLDEAPLACHAFGRDMIKSL